MGCSLCEGHFRCRHGLPTAGVMLADKKLVEVEGIGVVDQRDIAVKGECGIFRRVMKRHHKKRKFHKCPQTTCDIFSLPPIRSSSFCNGAVPKISAGANQWVDLLPTVVTVICDI